MNVAVSPTPQNVTIDAERLSISIGAPLIGVSIPAPVISVETAQPMSISTGEQIIRDTGDVPVYQGATEITPSQETQVLETYGCIVPENITVNPIPQNYGLITWNGATLTVS